MKKIIKIGELKTIRTRNRKKKIILAHGTFDFFHYGHLKHLRKSKDFADILVVSLTSDIFVRKGPGRPIYNQKQRAEIISSLDFVDYVLIADSPSGIEIINSLKPNYYSKGIEYKDKLNDFTKKISLEQKVLKKNRGKIFYTNELVLSASSMINQIRLNENTPKNIFLKYYNKTV